MLRVFLCTFVIWSCLALSGVITQGNSCETPDQQDGRCINIYNCTSILSLLKTRSDNPRVRQFLKASACGEDGETPLVCCPPETTKNATIRQNDKRGNLPESPACGFSNVTTPRVVNGVPAKLGEFPWMVVLGYKNPKNPRQPKWMCGGSLITEKHVLTAAHCAHKRNDLYIARLGDLDLYSDQDGATPVTIELVEAKIHENFDPVKFQNDIAILTLKEAPNSPTVWPICLPKKEPFRSMTYLNFSPTLAGWGSTSFNGPSSSALQEIFVPVLNNEDCERAFSQRAVINDKILCAGSTNGDKDACGGDSGGPLMNLISEGANYRAYQIGIVSYGFRCAQPGYPGVYTRITAFIDWIEKNV